MQQNKEKMLKEIESLLRKLPAEKVSKIREILETTPSKEESLKKISEVLNKA